MMICQLDFNREHLFLCTAPFLWYLREEKLEIQIWTSENDAYDYSQASASSTEKLLGSIYLDLSPLLNKQRKSHRLSLILPILKQGIKDFHGACVHIQLTMDKPKDFQELRVNIFEYRLSSINRFSFRIVHTSMLLMIWNSIRILKLVI